MCAYSESLTKTHKLVFFPFSCVQNICKHSYACQMQRRRTGFKNIDIESKWFSFFLKCFFVSRFQLELCDMNSNVTCYGSLLCRGESVCCNVGHLEYCMSLSAGLYWWFTAMPGHLLISRALFYHLQSNLVAAQDAVTVSLQRGEERNTWNGDIAYVCLCVFVYLRMAA